MQTRFSDDLVPLVKFPARHRREPQLFIVDPTSSSRKHSTVRTLVNRLPPSSPSRKGRGDTYFIERRTGGEIPSPESVQRHLVKQVEDRRLSGTRKVYEGCKTKEDHRTASRDFLLPEGWTIVKARRRNSSHIDKYYIEPETGKRFRSLVSVERRLNAVRNDTVSSVSMVHSERHPSSFVKLLQHVETLAVDPNPPKTVKCVLTGPDGNMFSAHVSGLDVSSSVKQTWSEAFVSLIQDCY